MKKRIIDDGFDSQLVETALFDGIFEIPTIEKPPKFIIPKRIIPFTKRKTDKKHESFICFLSTWFKV